VSVRAWPSEQGVSIVAPRPRLAHARYAAGVVVLFGVYFGAARFGIDLDVAHGVITPVWAPSGIALAALLLFGLRYWPGVALGAFAANSTSGLSALLAAGIAVGNTLEAVGGAYALRRLGFRPALARIKDVLAFVAFGSLAAAAIAATNGTTLLYLTDHVSNYGSSWVLWWFGDAAGILLVAPLLLVLVTARHHRPSTAAIAEWTAGMLALGGLAAVVFFAGAWRYPYVLFPLLIWAPLRFRQVGAATASFVVGAMASLGAAYGEVSAGSNATQAVQILQALICVVAISMLLVAAILAEREAANEALRQAQELTHIGSWEWDLTTDRIVWSDELFRIYGLQPRSRRVDYDAFLAVVHPDDRERVEAEVRRAYESGLPFTFEHRVALPGGGERLLEQRGRVEADESGTPVRMFGTAQDITHQRQLDRLRDGILATVSHELRTPLTSVLGFAITLKERRHALSDEVVGTLLDHIEIEAERLNRLLADLLDIDRHRRGLLAPERRPADVAALLERVAARHRNGSHALDVETEPLTAALDSTLVERIVDNLVANAFKHTPAGTRVRVAAHCEGDDLLIVVDDGGPGVPTGARQTIFDIFDRGAAEPLAVPGMGVGLSIVAQFASVHGGKAWVEDAPGGGASFRVLLPDCVLH
jgi:signal transduction histidine kinase